MTSDNFPIGRPRIFDYPINTLGNGRIVEIVPAK